LTECLGETRTVVSSSIPATLPNSEPGAKSFHPGWEKPSGHEHHRPAGRARSELSSPDQAPAQRPARRRVHLALLALLGGWRRRRGPVLRERALALRRARLLAARLRR